MKPKDFIPCTGQSPLSKTMHKYPVTHPHRMSQTKQKPFERRSVIVRIWRQPGVETEGTDHPRHLLGQDPDLFLPEAPLAEYLGPWCAPRHAELLEAERAPLDEGQDRVA
jgi:hypothetical protein